jgi:hypothetical protein
VKNESEQEMSGNLAYNFDFNSKLYGSLTCCKSATWGKRLYFPSEGRHAEDFFTGKTPTALAGSEPAILGTRDQHANH